MLYFFDPYVFDANLGVLRCRDETLPLQPKTLEVLHCLLNHGGEVVRRRDLFDSVWADEEVAEGNLTQHIFMLRQIFERYTPGRKLVATVAGKGYRFAGTLSPQPALPVASTDLDWRLYVRGTYFAEQRTLSDLRRAITCLEEAVTIAPHSAQVHCGLAQARLLCAEYLYGQPRAHFLQAETHAHHAIALDPANGEAQAVLGDVSLYYRWDDSEAARRFERASELAPTSLFVRTTKAWFFTICGRHKDAEAEMSMALRQIPHAPGLLTTLGALKFYAGRHSEAIDHLQDVIAMEPERELARYYLAMALIARGDLREAISAAEPHVEGAYPQQFLTAMACARALHGDTRIALDYKRRLHSLEADHFISSFNVAKIELALGDASAALAAMRDGIRARDPWLVFVDVHPAFAGVRTRLDFRSVANQRRNSIIAAKPVDSNLLYSKTL